MSRRPYEEIQTIVEQAGGEIHFERGGHGPGGAWVVTLGGTTTVFRSNGAGFPPMDRLYVPKVPVPTHYRDYTNTLIDGAREKWLGMLGGNSDAWKPQPAAGPATDLAMPRSAVNHAREVAPAILPPFDGAAEYLDRIKSSRGLAERNMEALVQELLIRLGHPPLAVVFRVGFVDVAVVGTNGKPRIVVEVKTSLRSRADRDSALRQAFDYANRNGATLVVITDADAYEIYDRTKGMDHASQLQANFRLSAFRETDAAGLNMLKP